jgi:hypothetical protein
MCPSMDGTLLQTEVRTPSKMGKECAGLAVTRRTLPSVRKSSIESEKGSPGKSVAML